MLVAPDLHFVVEQQGVYQMHEATRIECKAVSSHNVMASFACSAKMHTDMETDILQPSGIVSTLRKVSILGAQRYPSCRMPP